MGGRIVFPTEFPLRQAFWFCPIRSDVADLAHVFWFENVMGQVIAVRIQGIGQKNPEYLISYFAGIETSTSEDQFVDHLRMAWLFPPKLFVKILRDVPLNPEAVVCEDHAGCEAELVNAAQNFFCNLNPKIIKELGTDITVSAYNTVRSWPQQVFRNRAQACENYQWIRAELALGNAQHALPPLSAAVLNSIDSGKPFERLMAAHYGGVDRHALRCVAKLSQKYDWDTLPVLFAVIDAMKPDFRRHVLNSWSDMLPILRWCQRWKLEADTIFLRQFAKEIFHDGIAGAQRIFKRELPGHNPRDPYLAIEDYLRSLQPEHMQWDIAPERFGQTFQSRVQACGSVVAVFAESVAWHRGQRDAAILSDLNFTWPQLLDVTRLDFGKFRARELTSAAELAVEGVSQSNCIYTYSNLCAQGNDFIFSLEHSKGHQLRTTAHYAMGPDGLCLVEHSAYNNAPPCAAAEEDAAELLIFLIDSLQTK